MAQKNPEYLLACRVVALMKMAQNNEADDADFNPILAELNNRSKDFSLELFFADVIAQGQKTDPPIY